MARRRVAAKWMRDASDEQAVAEGCWFDPAAAKYVCNFLETFCHLSEGRWAGERIKLIPWQRDWLSRLYGWKRDDGFRRFQSSYVEVAKKNGKSPVVSGQTSYHLVGDGENGPKIYLNACDREQARIVFDTAKAMFEQSPDLNSRVEIIDSRNRIICPANRGVIIANSALVDSKDGRNASLVVFDEIHRFPDRKLYNVFQGAGASREQPMQSVITTAGEDDLGVWHSQRVYSERTIAGETRDTTHLGVIYRADPADDFDDPAVWAKANPSFGYTITQEQFGREMKKARENPIDWNDFLRKRFNVVAMGASKYFDLPRWDSCLSPAPLAIQDLVGLPCVMGLDLGSTSDFTALVVIAGDYESGYKLISRFWCPESQLKILEDQTRMPYRAWAEQGHLIATGGERTDYAFVRREINEIASVTKSTELRADEHFAIQLCTQLIEEDGLPLKFIRQGFISLNDPTIQFERLIAERKIQHDGNPIMRWCLGNAAAEKDAAGNVKLSKKKSREKIDGAAAAVNAVAALISPDLSDENPYNTRGLISL